MMHFLLIGHDTAWLEGLRLQLRDAGHTADTLLDVMQLANTLQAPEPFAAAIIAAFPTPGIDQAQAVVDLCLAGAQLHARYPGLPLLFVTPTADSYVCACVRRMQPAEIVNDEEVDTLIAAVERATQIAANSPWHFATVEIEVGVAAVKFIVSNDAGAVIANLTVNWSGLRRLLDEDEKYRQYRILCRDSNGASRWVDNWTTDLRVTGADLYDQVGFEGEAQAKALADCLRQVGTVANVHFRFSFFDNRMQNLPFELVWDRDKQRYLRELSPIARRIVISDAARTNSIAASPARTTLTGRVLFILSDAQGSFAIPDRTFAGQPAFTAPGLQNLDAEFEGLKAARAQAMRSPPELVSLQPGGGALDELAAALRQGPWDIVHFAGHSVRADDGEGFLLLPGARSTRPIGLRAADFAEYARSGDTQLAILSSCESSSVDMLFRMAQAGIPSAVGFRWEVLDTEAAMFTKALHEALAQGIPLGRSFHCAVLEIRRSRPASPTFLSPVLAVQDGQWAAPWAPNLVLTAPKAA